MAAYVIVDSDVVNPEGMKPYLEKVSPIVAAHGGKALVIGDNIEVREGDWTPKRLVLIEFPSMEAARGWYDSPEYQEILPFRTDNTRDKLLIVEGL